MTNHIYILEEENLLVGKHYGTYRPMTGWSFKTRQEARKAKKEYAKLYDNRTRVRKYVGINRDALGEYYGD